MIVFKDDGFKAVLRPLFVSSCDNAPAGVTCVLLLLLLLLLLLHSGNIN
jgi:hypothetical protein